MLYVGSSIHKSFIARIGKHWTTDSLKRFTSCSSGLLNSLLYRMPSRCFGTTAVHLRVTRNSLSSGFNTSAGHLVGERCPALLPPLHFSCHPAVHHPLGKTCQTQKHSCQEDTHFESMYCFNACQNVRLEKHEASTLPIMTLEKAPKG